MNVLFLGLGGIGQRHLRVLIKLFPSVNIYAVRKKNRNSEITDQLQLDTSVNIEEKYNINNCKTINDAVGFKLDFAIVSNPTSLHVETTLNLLEHKIPVLIEKPLSNNNNNIDKLFKLSKKNNTLLSVAFMMRFHPCSIKLREYIETEAIGKIYNVAVNVNSFFPEWHNYEKYNEFYAGRRDLGGGVVLTEIHEIDLLSLLFGKPECLFVVGGKRSSFDIDVEDNVSILMKFKKDGYEFSSTLNMSYVQKSPFRNITILGEHGNILWDMVENVISINNYTDSLSEVLSFEDFQRNDMFEKQLLNFVKLINSNEKIDKILKDSIGGHEIAMAIKESLSTGLVVSL